MNTFELFLLNHGYSWETSKILPFYGIFVCSLFVLTITFYKMTRIKKRYQLILSMLFSFLIVMLYFSISPIYSGDFTSGFKTCKKSGIQLNENELMVLGIPKSKHCFEIIPILNELQLRNKQLTIYYTFITDSPSQLKVYQSIADKRIHFKIRTITGNAKTVEYLKFPSVFVATTRGLYYCTNNELGPASLDFIESSLRN